MKKKPSQGITVTQIAAEAVRWLCLLGIALLVSRMFAGNKISSTPFDQMSNAVLSHLSMDKMQLADNQMIKRLYGIDPAAYEDVLLYYPTTNMGAEELFVIKLSAPSEQQESVQKAIEARLATQKKNFDGYGTYQTAMLNASQIVVRGNYILFISGDNPDQIVQDFEKAL